MTLNRKIIGGLVLCLYSFTFVTPQPAITNPMDMLNQPIGGSVTFSVTLTGNTNDPITIRWDHNSAQIENMAGKYSGANTLSLTVSNLVAEDEGNYGLFVFVDGTPLFSISAMLTILIPPEISAHPEDQLDVYQGTIAGFNVTAVLVAGITLSYHWQFSGIDIEASNTAKYSGVNSDQLTIMNVLEADNGMYQCRVTNMANGNSAEATSDPAQLTVLLIPTISVQPVSVAVDPGDTAVLTVTANGESLQYQWFMVDTGGDIQLNDSLPDISDSTTNTLIIQDVTEANHDGETYYCRVSNPAGMIDSNTATISVADPPVIVMDPESLSDQIPGQTVTFTVMATGTAPLEYEWMMDGVAIEDNSKYSGATTATLTVNNVTFPNDEGIFTVVVSNTAGSVTSGPATLDIIQPIEFTAQPEDQTIAAGQTAMFSAMVTGDSLTYQWQRLIGEVFMNLTDDSDSEYSGINNSTLSVIAVDLDDEGMYRVLVSNGASPAVVSSNTVTLSVVFPPVITTPPEDQINVLLGTEVVFTCIANGTGISYQWSKNNMILQNIDGIISGTNTSTLMVINAREPEDEGSYNCGAINIAGVVISNNALLNIINCPPLDAPVNGDITFTTDPLPNNDGNSIGTMATYSCIRGQLLSGNIMRICQSDGNWTGMDPVCLAIQCPALPDVTNGSIVYTMDTDGTAPYDYGTTATYKCDSGYSLTGKDTVRTCEGNGSSTVGEFDGEAPTCARDGFCGNEVIDTEDRRGEYFWSETAAGETIERKCVYNNESVGSRHCLGHLNWQEADLSNCITRDIFELQQLTKRLMNTQVTAASAENVVNEISSIVSNLDEADEQSNENLDLIVGVYDQIVETLIETNNFSVSTNFTENTVSVLDDISEWPADVVRQRSSSLVSSFEAIANNLATQDREDDFKVTENSIFLQVARENQTELINTNTNFSTPQQILDQLNSSYSTIDLITPTISLPPEVFNISGLDMAGLVFTSYLDTTLFQLTPPTMTNSSDYNFTADSAVLGFSVADTQVRNLSSPVNITLQSLRALGGQNWSEPICVSWQFDALEDRGNWTSEGCKAAFINETTGEVLCQCNHLTNFAILVNVNPPPLSEAADLVNQVLTIIGSVLSIVGLVITIFTLLFFRKLRVKTNTIFHVQLCIAILCMLLVFLIGIDRIELEAVCTLFSMLILYFTHVSVFWMGAEALLMGKELIFDVFSRFPMKKFIILISFIAWGVPLIFPVIGLSTLGTQENLLILIGEDAIERNISGGYCFLSHVGLLYGIFLGPIIVVLIFNTILFIIIARVLIKHSKKKLKNLKTEREENQKEFVKGIAKTLVSIIMLMVMFGLSWFFGALSIDQGAVFFQWLFVIFNTTQGFMLFLFFCVVGADAREEWKNLLTCHKYRQKMSFNISRSTTVSHARSLYKNTQDNNPPSTVFSKDNGLVISNFEASLTKSLPRDEPVVQSMFTFEISNQQGNKEDSIGNKGRLEHTQSSQDKLQEANTLTNTDNFVGNKNSEQISEVTNSSHHTLLMNSDDQITYL